MLPGWQQYWTVTLGRSVSDVPSLLGCWPHIAWGLTHGKLLPVSHSRHDEVCEQAAQMHLCATTEEWDRMVLGLYNNWGNHDEALNTLWNQLFAPPYNNWYIGYETKVPCLLPSQQAWADCIVCSVSHCIAYCSLAYNTTVLYGITVRVTYHVLYQVVFRCILKLV